MNTGEKEKKPNAWMSSCWICGFCNPSNFHKSIWNLNIVCCSYYVEQIKWVLAFENWIIAIFGLHFVHTKHITWIDIDWTNHLIQMTFLTLIFHNSDRKEGEKEKETFIKNFIKISKVHKALDTRWIQIFSRKHFLIYFLQ